MTYLSKLAINPIYIIGANTLLIIRYGLAGFMGTLMIILLSVIGIIITIINANLFREISELKDQRVDTTT